MSNKYLFFLFCLLWLSILSCTPANAPQDNLERHQDSSNVDATLTQNQISPGNLLSLSEAEKILGQEATLTDSATTTEAHSRIFNSTYTATTPEQSTTKTGNLYFMFEEYTSAAVADSLYAMIFDSNADHAGVKELNGIGDEAYFHSDDENFCFILARKGNQMIRMKVNKLTGMTSVDEFTAIAKSIVKKM